MRNEKSAKLISEAVVKLEELDKVTHKLSKRANTFYWNFYGVNRKDNLGAYEAIRLNIKLEAFKDYLDDVEALGAMGELMASALELGIMSEAEFKDGLAKINALEFKDDRRLTAKGYDPEVFWNCFKNIEIYSEQEQQEIIDWVYTLEPAFAHLFLKEVA